jgi:hypothetical protein
MVPAKSVDSDRFLVRNNKTNAKPNRNLRSPKLLSLLKQIINLEWFLMSINSNIKIAAISVNQMVEI